MMTKAEFTLTLFAGFFLTVILGIGQTNSPGELSLILGNAEKQAVEYQKGFKDLIAKETKTFENFKPGGELRRQKVIESNFLVYESKRDERVVSEFRNVTTVDGKAVSKKVNSSTEFFADVRRSGSIEKELKKIQKQSAKYDDTLEIEGLTLFQAPILSHNLRPYFTFELIGKAEIGGSNVDVISYVQTKDSPFISTNPKNADDLTIVYELPNALKKFQIRLSGKLWIDSETFQLWREERNLTVQTEKPFRLISTEFEYSTGNYGILLPKSIQLVQFRYESKSQIAGLIETRVRFEYSEFTKTKVEIEILDDDEPIKN